jgi:hypothetical protein
MPGMPEWARLVRLSNDELCLIGWYRHLSPDQKEYLQHIAAQLAESGRSPEDNVVPLPLTNTKQGKGF